jgi:alpha-L-fucosidase
LSVSILKEYWPANIPTTRMIQHEGGVEISVSRAQRLYNNKVWPNPVVVKLTNFEFVEQE